MQHLNVVARYVRGIVPCITFREYGTSERGISDPYAVFSCVGVIVCTNCRTDRLTVIWKASLHVQMKRHCRKNMQAVWLRHCYMACKMSCNMRSI